MALNKNTIIQLVKQVLNDYNIDYLDFSNIEDIVFDLIIKTNNVIVTKIFKDIECLKKNCAEELKKISNSLCAVPLIISELEKTQKIEDDFVGYRYDIPFVNVRTFEKILIGDYPKYYYKRGGRYVKIKIKDEEKFKQRLLKYGVSRTRIYHILTSSSSGIRLEYLKYVEDCIEPCEIDVFKNIPSVYPELEIDKFKVFVTTKTPHIASLIESAKLDVLFFTRDRKKFLYISDFLSSESEVVPAKSKKEILKYIKERLLK